MGTVGDMWDRGTWGIREYGGTRGMGNIGIWGAQGYMGSEGYGLYRRVGGL